MGQHDSAIKGYQILAGNESGIIVFRKFRRIFALDHVQKISQILIPAEHIVNLFYLNDLVQGLQSFRLICTIIEESPGMRKELGKLVVQICITKLIRKFGNIRLFFLRLIHYFINEFLEQAQLLWFFLLLITNVKNNYNNLKTKILF